MTEHTPTPWSLGSYNSRAITKDAEGIADGCDHYTVAVTSSHSLVGQGEAVANAAFIVKAVNKHDAMVKALDEIEALSDNCINAERYGAEDALEDLQAIRSAIKRMRVAVKSMREPDHG